jgi:hypothetical protein
MLIIWKRKGPLVILAVLLGSMIATLIITALGGQNSLLGAFFGGAFCLLPAVFNWLSVKYWLKNEGKRVMIDEQSGQKYVINTYSTFFFVRNTLWTWVFAVGGVIAWIILIYNAIVK